MSYRYQPFCDDHEIIGQNMIEFKNALESEHINPYLRQYGMLDLEPTTWYPATRLAQVFNKVGEEQAAMMSFVSIGMKSVETAIIPPEYRNMPVMNVLKGLDYAYHLNQRGTNIGKIETEEIDSHHARISFITPWPDDLWYGVCYSFMRLFSPKGTHITVSYDKDIPRRDNGGDATVIHVEWE